jgi:5-methylcytosine-specific restriction endonuclease McrA
VNSAKRRRRRRALLARNGAVCAYCGKELGTGLPFSRATLDHVVPISRGGRNGLENLILACKLCQRAKGDSLPSEGWAPTLRNHVRGVGA